MRGSPSCVSVVRRFVVSRTGVGGVAAALLASLAAWTLLTPIGQGTGVCLAVALACLATLALAATLWRAPAGVLRRDGSAWSSAGPVAAPAGPIPAALEVAIDFGPFLLLRFVPRPAFGRRSARCIPVERRGLEREWHAFGCAVYSPRPGAGRAGAVDPRLP